MTKDNKGSIKQGYLYFIKALLLWLEQVISTKLQILLKKN